MLSAARPGEDGANDGEKCFYLWLSWAGTQGGDEEHLLLRVTPCQHPHPFVHRVGRELILGFPPWGNLGSPISLPPSLCRGGWVRGRRAKQEQVGAVDGVFAQEPFASNFLSLPELMGQLLGATRVSHGKFHTVPASSPQGSSPAVPDVIF